MIPNYIKTLLMSLLKQKYTIANFKNISLCFAIFMILLSVSRFQDIQLIELIDAYKNLHNDYINLLNQIANFSSTSIEKDIETHELKQQLDIKIKKELEDLAMELNKNEMKKFYLLTGLYGLFSVMVFIMVITYSPP